MSQKLTTIDDFKSVPLMKLTISFKWLLPLSTASALLLTACSTLMPSQSNPLTPLVFVHGNGDSAALWQTTAWRYESNGWSPHLLHAIDVPYPLARDADPKEQVGRSSTSDHMNFLKSEVEAVLKKTGAKQVVLIGNSRGGNAIRNYVCNGGGAQVVSHAIIGGGTSHGVQAIPGLNDANEFSGAGPFLKQLNAPKNEKGDEVCGPTKWQTIRSDNNDKFAQPDGFWLGMKGRATLVSFEGPELKGANNVVIPRIDHRETSFTQVSFNATYQFLTGLKPTHNIVEEKKVSLNGKIFGLGQDPSNPSSGNYVNNLALKGAQLEVFEIDNVHGKRMGHAVHQKTITEEGTWGPFQGDSKARYEFVISAPGYATTHIYRSPFARSSQIIHMRPERMADADKAAQAVVSLTRPRGYFDADRDTMVFDGKSDLPGVTKGTGAGNSNVRLRLADALQRSISAEFNGEKLIGLTWPAAQGHTTVLELTY